MKKGPVCIGGLNFPSMLLVADCGCFVFGLRARFAVLLVFVVSCPYDKIRISDWGMCTSSLRLVVGVLFLPPFFFLVQFAEIPLRLCLVFQDRVFELNRSNPRKKSHVATPKQDPVAFGSKCRLKPSLVG